MELDVGGTEANVETVEVVAGEDPVMDPTRLSNHSTAAGLLEQQLVVGDSQEILVPTTEVENQGLAGQGLDPSLAMVGMSQQASIITIPVEPTSPSVHQQALQLVGAKRTLKESVASDPEVAGLLEGAVQPSANIEVPRKKSRNYLDSHKTIEKKRRDRINSCLDSLKSLVPTCRTYGSKKLDKAEILEMTIDYIKTQTPGAGRNSANLDLTLNQREWANDLTTWVIHNKLLYSGSNSLEQFCQALLLHLQSMGSGNALASATSMLLNQANANNEEDALLRQQTVTAQAAILQQLQQQQQQASSPKDGASSGNNQSAQQQLQQAQLTQLQALLLLQQQQQLLSQQQQQESDTQAQQAHLQQLQQLQQLQALLLQHIANEASSTNPVLNGTTGSEQKVSDQQGSSTATGTQAQANVSDGENVLTAANPMTSEAAPSSGGEELTPQTQDLGAPVTTEETVYTSAIADTLDENLLTVNVGVNQADTQTEISDPTGQMWSSAGSAGRSQSSSLLLLGGGSESEGEGTNEKSSQLMEAGIGSEVQEEVELMAQQEQ